jgi:thiol-disulfide isomerase/thioredoxin
LRLPVAALWLALAGCATTRNTRPERPAAPELTVAALDGAQIELAKLKGKVVLIDFWATWCEPCREEVPKLVALQKEKGPRGFQLVGFSMDDEATPVRAFYQEQSLNYLVAMGDAEIGDKFGGVLGVPVKVLIDKQGRVYALHKGAYEHEALEREIELLLAE